MWSRAFARTLMSREMRRSTPPPDRTHPLEYRYKVRYSGQDVPPPGLKTPVPPKGPRKVRADQALRIPDLLGHLDRAERPSDLDLPGYRLHALKGDLKGTWSATISGNWRIVFRFVDGDAFDVDLVDYH